MPKTIMTVDDSASVRQMVSYTLREAGYDVVEACDGVDAIEKIDNTVFSLIITDLNMPHMDGISLIKQLRSNQKLKFTPILMLTTESQNEKKLEGKNAGATGWIIKPFKPEQLITVVKKVIG